MRWEFKSDTVKDCFSFKTVDIVQRRHRGWCWLYNRGWPCWAQFYEYPAQQRSLWELFWFILWRRRWWWWARAELSKHLTETIRKLEKTNTWQKQSHGNLEKICLWSSFGDWTVTGSESGHHLTEGKDKEKKLHKDRDIDRKKAKTGRKHKE